MDVDVDVDVKEDGIVEVEVKPVLLRSQLIKPVFAHTLAGIEPERFGLDVSERVVRDEGRDAGGEVKGLLVRYLGLANLVSHD